MPRLDRRALFSSGAAAALLAASGLSLSAAPQRGGRLRLAVPKADAQFDAAVHGAVFDTLTDIGPDGLLRGELATEWRSDPNGRDWVLTLRRGVTFHDGRAFTAEDAARVITASGLIAAQVEVTAPDTLRLTLDTPDAQLPYLLADPRLALTPEGHRDGDLVGTGLYHVAQLRPGRHFVGHRVASHYKDGQAGWFESVEIAVIPDADVRAEALREGFVDVAALPSVDGLGEAMALIKTPGSDTVALAARQGVGIPQQIGHRTALDDGRLAQRWWMG